MSNKESGHPVKGITSPELFSTAVGKQLSVAMAEQKDQEQPNGSPQNPSRRRFLKSALATLGLAFVGSASSNVVKAAENLSPLETERISGLSIVNAVEGRGEGSSFLLTENNQEKKQVSELYLTDNGILRSRSLGEVPFGRTTRVTAYGDTIAIGGVNRDGKAVIGVVGSDGSGILEVQTSRPGNVLEVGAIDKKIVVLIGEEDKVQEAKYALFDPMRHDVIDLAREGEGIGIMTTGFRVTDPNRFVSFGQSVESGYLRYLVLPGENKLQTIRYPGGPGLITLHGIMSSYMDSSGNDVVIYPGVVGRGDGPNAGVNVTPIILDTISKVNSNIISQKAIYPDSTLYGRQRVDIIRVATDTIKAEQIFGTAKRIPGEANISEAYIEISNLAGDYSSRYLLSREGQWPDIGQYAGWIPSLVKLLKSGNHRKLVVGLTPGGIDPSVTRADRILVADISNLTVDRTARVARVNWQDITQSIIIPPAENPQSVSRVYLAVTPKVAKKP